MSCFRCVKVLHRQRYNTNSSSIEQDRWSVMPQGAPCASCQGHLPRTGSSHPPSPLSPCTCPRPYHARPSAARAARPAAAAAGAPPPLPARRAAARRCGPAPRAAVRP
ncbi:hypothetical protein F751_3861 [Auxenochlorella protothecoides]|uniref:Uncharacterized protein n=1 Tax=Auxenochlorella protothecoides TaxID=3075 RepID=A0A087SRJ7_AUXPR|nr:hypothetical protein F751_3861 [Auxenochlorella protothecoides]KFM28351.1 hypothetical protein F751_3861 [Auxenochlorella protothecoides]